MGTLSNAPRTLANALHVISGRHRDIPERLAAIRKAFDVISGRRRGIAERLSVIRKRTATISEPRFRIHASLLSIAMTSSAISLTEEVITGAASRIVQRVRAIGCCVRSARRGSVVLTTCFAGVTTSTEAMV